LTPRAALTKHLFDGDDSLFTGNFDKVEKVVPQAMPPSSPVSEPPVAGPAPFDPDAT
jgi:sec-independent protein translocase protein TatB